MPRQPHDLDRRGIWWDYRGVPDGVRTHDLQSRSLAGSVFRELSALNPGPCSTVLQVEVCAIWRSRKRAQPAQLWRISTY
jgi:hypothetical protein